MSLETLIAPIKWMDELLLDIHQFATRSITANTRLDSNKLSVLVESMGVVVSFAAMMTGDHIMQNSIFEKPEPTLLQDCMAGFTAVLGFHNLVYTQSRIDAKKKAKYTDVKNSSFYISQRVQQTLRLPLLIGGLAVGYAMFKEEAYHPYYIIGNVLFPTSISSALYTNDDSPKKPIWKKAYEYLKEKTALPKLKPANAQYTALEEAVT